MLGQAVPQIITEADEDATVRFLELVERQEQNKAFSGMNNYFAVDPKEKFSEARRTVDNHNFR